MKQIKLKPCPDCQSTKLLKVHSLTRGPRWFEHYWWIECKECHWCGPVKLFLWRAKKAWNKEVRKCQTKKN